MKPTTAQIELEITRSCYPPRRCLVLPNASWGMGLSWEADLVVVSKSGYVSEIEIKTSVSDFRADFKKRKHRLLEDSLISRFIYAMPRSVWEKADLTPDARYGLIVVDARKPLPSIELQARWIRRPQKLGRQSKLSDKQITNLYRLAYLRMWDLKWAVFRTERQNK